MTQTTQAGMHEEHVQWRSEHAQWLDDIGIWQMQNQRALADLARLEVAIRDHGASLAEHTWKVRSHERVLCEHEHEIGELQVAGAGEQADPKLASHEAWAHTHASLAKQHEVIKEHHRKAVVSVRRMLSEAHELL